MERRWTREREAGQGPCGDDVWMMWEPEINKETRAEPARQEAKAELA